MKLQNYADRLGCWAREWCMRFQSKTCNFSRRDNSGSEYHEKKISHQPKLTRKYGFLASSFNKILCLITFCYEIFLPSSQFQ